MSTRSPRLECDDFFADHRSTDFFDVEIGFNFVDFLRLIKGCKIYANGVYFIGVW